VAAAGFLVLAVPGLALWGADGFVAGRICAVALALVWRARYVHALLPGVRLWALIGGAALPIAAGAAAALALRLALWGGTRTAAQAVVEGVLFVAVFGALVLRFERGLLAELRAGFVRPGQQGAGQ
jgi:hypothetical protein